MPTRLIARVTLALSLVAVFGVAALARSAAGSPTLVVSQIYTRGGEPGATFRSDYVEFLNRSQQSIDLRDYKFFINDGASTTLVFSFVGSFAVTMNAGQYLLFELSSSGPNGAPLPVFPDTFSSIPVNLSGTRGWVAVGRSSAQFPPGGCPSGPDLVDLAGYGSTPCFEGSAAPAPPANAAAFRLADGCVDRDSNAADFQVAPPNPRNNNSAHNVCAAEGQSLVRFAATGLVVSEATTTAVEIRVVRAGDVSVPATVDYATTTARAASERSDFTLALGTLRFAAGETEKTFTVLINDDAHVESAEEFEIELTNPTGNAALHPFAAMMRVTITSNDQSNSAPNLVDDTTFFVRQHYHDFLNREPDAEGLQFWTNNIESCGADAQCREVKRIDTSAAFFLSIEFQETGFLVHRLYRAALPPASGRPRGLPRLREFVRDTREVGRGVVVGQGEWAALLEANKQEFVERFAARPDFLARYPLTMSAAEYVDALDAHAGSVIGAGRVLTGGQRDVLVGGLEIGTETRGSVLRQIAEHRVFSEAERNRAFVLMQYIGYLRRHPLDHPDFTFAGYDFWLAKLEQFNGNYVDAEMVKAFITSIEYRQRFGQ